MKLNKFVIYKMDKDYKDMSRNELLQMCEELNLTKYKSKTIPKLIELIQSAKNNIPKHKENTKITIIPEETPLNNVYNQNNIHIENKDGLEFLKTITNNSIDLILTDPPYIISRDTGMDKHLSIIKENEENGIEYIKTEQEWEEYKKENDILNDDKKELWMKYGSIYGKKFGIQTQYGNWDSNFTMDTLEKFIEQYYLKLKKGGTIIIFFDLWKITPLHNLLEKYKFKQIRFIEWIKTNTVPINSKINYLSNAREIALVAVKDGKPTFHSQYDKGIYEFPIQGGKNRFHPTQKSLPLFEELILKHSNENDIVLDTFLGGGTTAIASKNTKRKFKGCEISKEYYDQFIHIIQNND